MSVKSIPTALAMFGLLGAVASPAQAGFFESLFGASPLFRPAPQPYVIEPARPLYMEPGPPRVTGKRQSAVTEKPTPAEIAAIKATTIMTDKTLRDGDAVMTADGIRIFRGPVGDRHVAADFVPLAKDRNTPKAQRAELVAIDAQRGAADDWQEAGEAPVVTGRSVATAPRRRNATGPGVAVIRRVGP